jgi:hypothetical protein
MARAPRLLLQGNRLNQLTMLRGSFFYSAAAFVVRCFTT